MTRLASCNTQKKPGNCYYVGVTLLSSFNPSALIAAPPPLDIGFLLTLSEEQMSAWDAFLVGSRLLLPWVGRLATYCVPVSPCRYLSVASCTAGR